MVVLGEGVVLQHQSGQRVHARNVLKLSWRTKLENE